jgi:hypothetical protein
LFLPLAGSLFRQPQEIISVGEPVAGRVKNPLLAVDKCEHERVDRLPCSIIADVKSNSAMSTALALVRVIPRLPMRADWMNNRCSGEVWNNATCASRSLVSVLSTIEGFGKAAAIASRTER